MRRNLTLTAILTLSSTLLAADSSAVSSAVGLAKAEALAKADPPSPVSTGFRGDGNAWCPAATPPLEWWDGRPAMVDGTTMQDGKLVPIKIIGYADRQPKNILWKVRLPSWGEAQPLVVGGRIIVLGEPDLVLCYDANSGKELWRDRIEVMTLPVLGTDRRTLEPAPADGAKRQVVWELARAAAYLQRNIRSKNTTEVAAMGKKAAATWGEWKRLLAANDPRFVPVADKVLAALDESNLTKELANKNSDPLASSCGDWAMLTKEYRAPIPSIPYGDGLQRDLPCNVGSVFSTPTSDGKVVVSVFGYGQVACHDLATGKRLWAWRDTLRPEPLGGDQIPSPRLCQDIVMVLSSANTELLGIKLGDGTVAWRTSHPGQGNKPFGNYVTPLLVHLSDGKGGKAAPVLITNLGWAVRPSDGAILGEALFPKPNDKSLSVNLLPGEKLLVVENGCATSGNLSHARIYQLKMTSPNTVTSTLIPQIPNFDSGEFVPCRKEAGYMTMPEQMSQQIPNYFHGESLAVNDRFICGDRNITTLAGHVRWGGSQTGGWFVGPEMASVIAGQYLIGGLCGEKYRTRSDGSCTTPMKVWSLAGPQPWLVAEHNLVGDATLPSDPVWERYLKPAGYDLARNVGNDHGMYGFFGNRLGGVVPQGDRLYLQGMTHLYCIGPATKGTLQDDPKVVASIRSEKDPGKLSDRLTDPSAQYRFESLRQLRTLGAVPAALTNQLAVLIVNDPYEEIRAAAVDALNAAQAGSGTATIMAELTAFAGMPAGNWWEAPAMGVLFSRGWHAATLRVLGESIDAPLAKTLAESKPAVRQTLLLLTAKAGLCGPQVEQVVVAYLRSSKRIGEMDTGVLDATDLLIRAGKTKTHAEVITTALLTQTTGFTRESIDRRKGYLGRIIGAIDILMENGHATGQIATILGNLLPEGVEPGQSIVVISRIQRLGKPAADLAPRLKQLKASIPDWAWIVDPILTAFK